MATYHGLDPHDDNKWEEKAKGFDRKNYQSGCKKKIVFEVFS